MTRTAVVAGATGLVGGVLLDRLLGEDTWDLVVVVGRRPVEREHPRLEQQVVSFADLPDLPPCTDVFSCLGTTIKAAGSQDAFRAVDHDAVVALSEAAYRAGAERFLHVTALGASPLQPVATATSVRVRQGKRLRTDGPFAETREQLGGYFLVEANTLDEAVEIAGRLPGARVGTVEVRPVMEVAGLPGE